MNPNKNLKIPFVVQSTQTREQTNPSECPSGLEGVPSDLPKEVGSPTKELEEKSRNIWSVSEFTHRVGELLESGLGSVLVKGEVSGFIRASSGHCYFQLKDEEAILRVVIFRGIAERIRFQVENGLQLVVGGDIRVYMQRGEYQLQAVRVLPQGMGELQLAFEQLQKRLQAEGLFDEKLKRKLPWLPRAVGVVTSPNGAALHDILEVLNRRFLALPVVVQPCVVQGAGAGQKLSAAVQSLSTQAEELGIDVIIVGRGGGSAEDLWAFNDEGLARAIRACSVPVVSAVGHEIDFTIADLVADQRAPTPSAAAEIVSPRQDDLLDLVMNSRLRLHRAMEQILIRNKEKLRHLQVQIRSPIDFWRYEKQRLYGLQKQLYDLKKTLFDTPKAHLAQLKTALDALSPLAVLARGYAIVKNRSGQALLCASKANLGEALDIRLHQGELNVRVEGMSVADAKSSPKKDD